MTSELHLYDTATRVVDRFVPITPGKVGIYLCGATVQAPPHIGHIRSGVNFDILRRWLTATGYDVTFIRNVTDIDDKILHKAVHEEIPWWAVAMKYERHLPLLTHHSMSCHQPMSRAQLAMSLR